MNPLNRHAALVFFFRLALVIGASWMPLPYFADAYTTAVGEATNAVLAVVDSGSRLGVRFEPPARIAVRGSWQADLRLEDRTTGLLHPMRLDVRTFSYRPIMMFVALAAASTIRGRRANAVVWGGGLLTMAVVTTLLSSLPLLSRLGAAGVLGVGPGLAAQTLYQALATPVMVYAIPALLWWGLMRLAGQAALGGDRAETSVIGA